MCKPGMDRKGSTSGGPAMVPNTSPSKNPTSQTMPGSHCSARPRDATWCVPAASTGHWGTAEEGIPIGWGLEQVWRVLLAHPARIQPCILAELQSHVPGWCHHLQWHPKAPRALPASGFPGKASLVHSWGDGSGGHRCNPGAGGGTVALAGDTGSSPAVAQGRVWGHFHTGPVEPV